MSWRLRLSLGLRNLVFMIIVPATGAVYAPWWILTRGEGSLRPVVWPALLIIVVGVAVYVWCVGAFAGAGRGTPAPWDAPRRLVAVGPYRLVRNPIYIAAFLVIGGEAWLFLSMQLLVYLVVAALAIHLFVLLYEEPTLGRRFGERYEEYRRKVPRWIPRLHRADSPA